MAERGEPSVLRHVVIFLRSVTGLTQEQFGKKARVAQSEVSEYELGRKAPPEAALRRMAEAAGIDWTLVVYLRQACHDVLAAGRRIRRAEGAPMDLTALEPVLLTAASHLVEAGNLEPVRPSRERQRREAEEIWSRLDRFPVPWSRRLIELSPRSGDWGLAVQACEASVWKAAANAEEALDLAHLALSIAERVEGEEGWRSRLTGYCWACLGNARRVANDLEGADEAFTYAWKLWREGADVENLLPEWRLLDLEAP